MKNALKRGEIVVVIAGDDKGKAGKIINVLRDKSKIVVDGVAVSKKHMRKSQEYPEGVIIEKPMPIHSSNVMLKSVFDKKRKRENKNA